jgi:hypothetical protein
MWVIEKDNLVINEYYYIGYIEYKNKTPVQVWKYALCIKSDELQITFKLICNVEFEKKGFTFKYFFPFKTIISFPPGNNVYILSRTPPNARIYSFEELKLNDSYYFTTNFKSGLFYGKLVENSEKGLIFDDLIEMSEVAGKPKSKAKTYTDPTGFLSHSIHRIFKIPDETRLNYITLTEGSEKNDERTHIEQYLYNELAQKAISEFMQTQKSPKSRKGGKRIKKRTRKSKLFAIRNKYS